MKYIVQSVVVVVLAICFMSCVAENDYVLPTPENDEPDHPVWTFNPNEKELGTDDFYTFDIKPDYSELKEKVYTDSLKKMYVENSKFIDTINITYNGNKAVVGGGNPANFSAQTNGAHVTITTMGDVALNLSGTSENGSLKILGEKKVRINLKGVNLKNPKGPAINNQSIERCFIVTDSNSVLRDDSLYAEVPEEEKQKGCVCSNGSMSISGKAPLKIVANGANAIHSGKTIFVRRGSYIDIESHAGSAIKAKNKVKIEGGVININSTGRGGHGIAANKEVLISGGRTTIISNSGLSKDGKNSRGIKSDSIISITGGIVRVKESSLGGKGIRAEHKFYAKNCIIDVLTFGQEDKSTGSKNRGIKADDEIRIDSARVRVRTENGLSESLSSRFKIIVNNSLVELKSQDDAFSAGETGVADIEINNGHIFADAGNDALDSNGSIHINDGILFLMGRSRIGRGMDCDFDEFRIGPNATVVSLGKVTSRPTYDLLEHPACLSTRLTSDTLLCISTTGENDNLICYNTPKFWFAGSYKALINVPEFKKNVSYDFCRSAIVKPKHTFHGLMIGGTAQDKKVINKHTFTRTFNIF